MHVSFLLGVSMTQPPKHAYSKIHVILVPYLKKMLYSEESGHEFSI